jgi:GNAT superfamily N-acetyltransferase
MNWVFQGDDDQRTVKLLAFFGFLCAEANIPLAATFLTEGGCACWTPPPGRDDWPEDREVRFAEVLRAACDDGDLARLAVLASTMQRCHPEEPHWYLGTLATVRSLQAKGVGTALLGHGLALVDRDSTPAYLESSNPRNLSLYERHGFQVTGQISLPGGPSLIAMWREAGGRNVKRGS